MPEPWKIFNKFPELAQCGLTPEQVQERLDEIDPHFTDFESKMDRYCAKKQRQGMRAAMDATKKREAELFKEPLKPKVLHLRSIISSLA